MGLPYDEEIMIVGQTMWTQSTSVTDGRTDGRTDRITITKNQKRTKPFIASELGGCGDPQRGLKFYIGLAIGEAGGRSRTKGFSLLPRQFERSFYRSACPLNKSDINFLDFTVSGFYINRLLRFSDGKVQINQKFKLYIVLLYGPF